MIHTLYTLKSNYRKKNIYIWNVNQDSIVVFSDLMLMKINVHGFIMSTEYIGERFMNRPIVTVEQVELDENAIILLADTVSETVMSTLQNYKTVRWSDAREIDTELKRKRSIIYGIGYGADRLCEKLNGEGIDAELYCVTEKNKTSIYRGKRIIEASELQQYKDFAIIISVVKTRYRGEILDILSDFEGDVYMDEIIKRENAMLISFAQNIDYAIKECREIYLYGKKDMLAQLLREALLFYDVEISGYVDDIANEKQGIKGIIELISEKAEDKLIIINKLIPESLIKARDLIESVGFTLEKKNYTSLQWYTRAKKLGKVIYADSGKRDWKLYGKEMENQIRILVLGNSSSSEVFCTENWVSRLYKKLNSSHYQVAIYNGAHIGGSALHELSQLVRDGHILKPHIVISMSGVNDLVYMEEDIFINDVPHNLCYLMEEENNNETPYLLWLRTEKIKKMVSEFYGARFFGFLQPMNVTMTNMTLREKSLFEDERRLKGSSEFARFVNEADGYINLMRLFEHLDEMYIDEVHYSSSGHEAIAREVYDTIMPAIQIVKKQ